LYKVLKGKKDSIDRDMPNHLFDHTVVRFWFRIPLAIRAILIGLFVSTIGTTAWPVIGTLIPPPISILIMIVFFWLYWKYFSGSWWPKITVEARSNSFRSIKLSPNLWKWGLVAAALFVILAQSSFVITFRLIDFPAESFTSGYNVDTLPLWLAWLFVVMSSLVAGIFEETGFRGYMQVPLEEHYGPGVGVTIVSILFIVVHLHQTWLPPLLFQIFALSVLLGILAYKSGSLIPGMIAHVAMDIFNFSYWWTDIAGRFNMRTIFETGIDFHFLLMSLVFVTSTVLFFITIGKISGARKS
jgi:membrane protease YdiL (CAAX protease family)